jgi:hypothetical protein
MDLTTLNVCCTITKYIHDINNNSNSYNNISEDDDDHDDHDNNNDSNNILFENKSILDIKIFQM